MERKKERGREWGRWNESSPTQQLHLPYTLSILVRLHKVNYYTHRNTHSVSPASLP